MNINEMTTDELLAYDRFLADLDATMAVDPFWADQGDHLDAEPPF